MIVSARPSRYLGRLSRRALALAAALATGLALLMPSPAVRAGNVVAEAATPYAGA